MTADRTCLTLPLLEAAETHLRKVDPIMAGLIDQYGPCSLANLSYNPFHTLAISIISQQLSAKAAKTIEQRVSLIVPSPFHPQDILQVSPEKLRKAGLSFRKIFFIQKLAEKVISGELSFDALSLEENEVVIKKLDQLPGVGLWTAEMFLIFGLKRPDILSMGDAGLRRAANMLYEFDKNFTFEEIGNIWSPYRSVASWYLWKHVDMQ